MNTKDNNKLIAEFLGATPSFFSKKGKRVYEMYGFIEDINDGEDEQHHFTTKQMLFNSNWNWLMDVVGKIEELGYEVVVGRISCQVNKILERENPISSIVCGDVTQKIGITYDAIVQFIQWYNEQQKQEIMANEIQKVVDHDNDRVIFFSVENDTITAIDYRQGITDPTERVFDPEEEILLYFNKIHLRTKGVLSIEESLRRAVEAYCVLNVYE